MRCRRALALRRGVDALWLAAVIALVACVKPIGGLRFDPPDGGDVGDIGGVGGDDMAMNPDAGCVPQSVGCNGNVLQTCRTDGSGYDETTCAAGCGGGSPMRCLVFVPHDPITAADLDPTALAAAGAIFTSGTQYILNTDDGSIVDQNGTKLRLAGSGVISGIRFRQDASGVSIWSFNGLVVPQYATLILAGQSSAALLSTGDMSVAGLIDARGHTGTTLCADNSPGPGGAKGGVPGTNGGNGSSVTGTSGAGAGGPSGGGGGGTGTGGGGGGFGDSGGDGGPLNVSAPGGVHGSSYGSATLNPLVGGSGGGAGGNTGGTGGGGGGGVRLVATGTLTIDGTASARGGVNTGGCGGKSTVPNGAGGGGGAGGSVFVEAPTVIITNLGGIAANGGGGGGLAGGNNGSAGQLATTRAPGGATSAGVGGAAGNTAGGNAATTNTTSSGGGGAAGRILILTGPGRLTLQAGAVVSPALGDKSSTMETISSAGNVTAQ